MKYKYHIQQANIHGIECFIGRLYADGKLVHDTTAMSHAGAYTTIYRHWVRLTELDTID